MVLTVICAWCGVTIKQGNSEKVSHGICAKCTAKFLPE